jgi:hypothetical protein
MCIRKVFSVFVFIGVLFVVSPLFLSSFMEMTSEAKLTLLYSGLAFAGLGLFGFLFQNSMNSLERDIDQRFDEISRLMDYNFDSLRRDCQKDNEEVYRSIDSLWQAQEKKNSR